MSVSVTKRRKKIGRPKKRGPKKKRIRRKTVKTVRPRPGVDYKIVSVLNGKQNGYFGQFFSYSDARDELDRLEALNDSVDIPRETINSETVSESVDEYLLLEKDRDGSKPDGRVRNEYGKFVVNRIVNSEEWVVRDKRKRMVEETFWVYGFDPHTERKTFREIAGLIRSDVLGGEYDIARVALYKNKLLILDDGGGLHMVICKNESDSVRLYNAVEKEMEDTGRVFMIGSYGKVSDARRELEDMIADLTGWSREKIQDNHT